MVSAIRPAVRRGLVSQSGVLFLLGTSLGGVGLGLLLLALKAIVDLPGNPRAAVFALSAVVVGLLAPFPLFRRQVNRREQRQLLRSHLTWGVQLGFAFATTPASRVVMLFAGLAALSDNPADAFMIGPAFGLTRGLVSVWLWRPGMREREVPVIARTLWLQRTGDLAHAAGQRFALVIAVAATAATLLR